MTALPNFVGLRLARIGTGPIAPLLPWRRNINGLVQALQRVCAPQSPTIGLD